MGSSRPAPRGGWTQAKDENRIQVGTGDAAGAQKRLDQMLTSTQLEGWGSAAGKRLDTLDTINLRKEMQGAERSRLNREIDLARGRERGEQDFSEGALGRVRQDLSPELQELQDARTNIAREGFGADAFQAAREARLGGLQRQQQQQMRQLRANQAGSGVMGALSGAQQSALMGQQQRATQDAERQLFLDDIGQRQQSMSAAESTVRGNEADTLGRQQFNLAQAKGELMGRITAQYGEAALGVAERGAAQAAQASKDYAMAVRNQGGGKK